ncbi:MAG: glyoxylate/hydroxypyruvate reductase A [Zymomonas mobilis]|uniref:Glyoxylate/hydroxypyruvate reductase A n=1 Tax=Zymomonas mobilis TaxID=542 RepID=A0A542VYU1_ZYMMB|nr:glyoxylate/hydroxypyruvate reductase A [Zymomonas mobilis]TQL16496.1 glyoxylate/hydroxypyruvate reductase A [Zymomonas mobilis]
MNDSPILLATSLAAPLEKIWLQHLQAAMPEEKIITLDQVQDASAIEIALIANPPAGALGHFSNLKWIQSLWAGVENLLADKTLPDIPICRLIDPDLSQAMAETVVAAVMGVHRYFDIFKAQQQKKIWAQLPSRSTRDCQVTVLGLGEMGRVSAASLVSLGFVVKGWSRSKKTLKNIETYQGADGLREAVDRADILVNLLPLTDQTKGILSRNLYQYLAPDACLVNLGRGAHLIEADLLEYLDKSRMRHAVLDVFSIEPLPEDHVFWEHPRVTVLPHIAATTNPVSASSVIAKNIRLYRQNGMIPVGCNRSLGY